VQREVSRANGRLPSVRSITATDGVVNLMLRLSPSCRNIVRQQDGSEPNLIKHCAVLAAVNIASRRLWRWPYGQC